MGQISPENPAAPVRVRSGAGPLALLVLAAVLGLALMADAIRHSSATYDEVAYLRVAAHWWRTGDQEAISRMGSPLTFWKLQQAPVLWTLDAMGLRELVDDPIAHQAVLLPLVRLGSLWIWALGLLCTALWARCRYGLSAMALAALIFALEPNLLAHGALVTMEAPLVACTAAVCLLFDRYLTEGARWAGWLAAVVSGLAFSCKFTAVLLPPLLALAWVDALRRTGWTWQRAIPRVARGMLAFGLVMLATDLVVTGLATLPPSKSRGEHPALAGRLPGPVAALVARLAETPLPQDLVAFAIQSRHQRSGGPSYLFGTVRQHGWWYYYLVALAVKVPLALGLLVGARLAWSRRIAEPVATARMPALFVLGLLAVTALGSSRNYGVRYLLPMAPAAIVWISGLAAGPRRAQVMAAIGVLGLAAATARCHPYELSYFNRLAGGTAGGRRILADSNLDWGQGCRTLARLQARNPEYADLTLFYFGDTEPSHYGVVGVQYVVDAGTVHPGLPERFEATTRFVAVSASLQDGPWGPAGYFESLRGQTPVAWTDDGTIAVYRTPESAQRRGSGFAGGTAVPLR